MEQTDSLKKWFSNVHLELMDKTTDSSYVYLYGIDVPSGNITSLFCGKSDIYDLIEQDSTSVYFYVYDMLAFATFGWASPNTDLDTPPSEHPDRKRVLLTNYLSSSSKHIVSAIDFMDNSETIWEYDNSTQGTLKQAFYNLYTQDS